MVCKANKPVARVVPIVDQQTRAMAAGLDAVRKALQTGTLDEVEEEMDWRQNQKPGDEK